MSQSHEFAFRRAASASNDHAAHAVAETSVRQLIANGKCKAALESAKQHHKVLATPVSEALLVDAYAARIEALLQQNLVLEAKSLVELVHQRYPASRARLEGLSASVAVRSGALHTLLAPLRDPQLRTEARAAIEQVVRRKCATWGRWHPAQVSRPNIPYAGQLSRWTVPSPR